MATRETRLETAEFNKEHFPDGVNYPFLNLSAQELDAKFGGEKGIFHDQENRDVAKHLPAVLEMLDKQTGFPGGLKGRTVVDLGCGTGFITRELAKRVGEEAKVLATEISPGFIDLCLAEGDQPKNVEYILTPEASLEPVPSGVADLVFLCDVYHHFTYPSRMMQEIKRIMKPAGTIDSTLSKGSPILVLLDYHRDAAKCWSHPPEGTWVLDHVRADQQTFETEITRCGFTKLGEGEVEDLIENYIVFFAPSA